MKYSIEQISQGENEVIIRYRQLTPEVERILNFVNSHQGKLIGYRDGSRFVIGLSQILYIESVEGKTFAYLEKDVLQVDFTLTQLEQMLNGVNFFRCSKSMILNIDKVKALKSLASNRIDATMCNGEHILISRTYASDFRKRLKGGRTDE